MGPSNVRMRALCFLNAVLLLFSAALSSAQSSFDASRECYDLNAKMGKEDSIRFWTEPASASGWNWVAYTLLPTRNKSACRKFVREPILRQHVSVLISCGGPTWAAASGSVYEGRRGCRSQSIRRNHAAPVAANRCLRL